MTVSKIKKIINILILICVVLCIFINPCTGVESVKKYTVVIDSINNFFKSINIGYKFKVSDICAAFRFTEYCVFGIMISVVDAYFSKKRFSNIFSLLFFGLSVSFSEIYLKSLQNHVVYMDEILISFIEFCIGLIFYIFIIDKFFTKKKTCSNSKYKTYKYDRRR